MDRPVNAITNILFSASSNQDTAECWIMRLDAYLRNGSFLVSPARECINQYSSDSSLGIGKFNKLNSTFHEFLKIAVLKKIVEIHYRQDGLISRKILSFYREFKIKIYQKVIDCLFFTAASSAIIFQAGLERANSGN